MDDDSEWDEPTWSAGEMEKAEDMLPCSFFLMQAVRNDMKHNRLEHMVTRLSVLNPTQLKVFLEEYHEWNTLQEKIEADTSEVTDDFSEDDVEEDE
jgi:hypothetical protein